MALTKQEATQQLVDFLDNNYTSLVQALKMAADSNERDANDWIAEYAAKGAAMPPGARALMSSAISWRAIADELSRVYNAFPEEG